MIKMENVKFDRSISEKVMICRFFPTIINKLSFRDSFSNLFNQARP